MHSFDVFDTALVRVTASPEAAFLLLGRSLARTELISCTPEVFARMRIEAESRAHANLGAAMTLADIYSELATSLRLSDAKKFELMDRERSLQADILEPVPPIEARIAELRDMGERIIFVSDMHHSSRFLEQVLTETGLFELGDHCYVSNELGMTKSQGVFSQILALEDVLPSQVTHTGNHPQADVLRAENEGLGARLFEEGNLTRYEEILDRHLWETGGLSSLMAGASRLARLSTPASSAREAAVRDVVSGVVAPLLVGFLLWTLRQAEALGLERLYFLSRDGQILLQLAAKLVDHLGRPLDLRYLYASRLSWNQATIANLDEHWIWNPLPDPCSLDQLFSRLGVTSAEIGPTLAGIGLSEKDWKRPMGHERLRSLAGEEQVRELIFERARSKRQLLEKYYEQEGLFDDVTFGIVDLGWAGSMFSAASRIIAAHGGSTPAGLYFAKNASPHIDAETETLTAYFFDERISSGIPDDRIKNALEIFCSGDHGTVLGFEEADGQVSPILEEEVNQRAIDWGLPLLRSTAESFVDHLVLDPELVDPFADVRAATAEAFRAFWASPSRTEAAAAWGSMPWEDHLAYESRVPQTWAQRYDLRDVGEAFRLARYPRQHKQTWVPGSLAQSPLLVRKLIRLSILAGRLKAGFSGTRAVPPPESAASSTGLPMRFLMVAPSTTRGGVEEYILQIASGAIKEGWDVHAGLPFVEGTRSLTEELSSLGARVHRLPISEMRYRRLGNVRRDLPNLARTSRLLRKVEPDVAQVVLPMISQGFGSILAAGLLRTPTLVTFQLVPDDYTFTPRRLEAYRWARSRGQQWMTVSDHNREVVTAAFDVPGDQLVRIYNGAASWPEADGDVEKADLRKDVRDELGLPEEAVIALTVGHLRERKGHSDLIDVIPELLDEFPDLRFVWIGEGNQRGELISRLRADNVDEKVVLTGYRPDVSRFFGAADLFLFPTHYEGSPIVLAEAMAHRLPIVSSDASGISEIIEHDVHGLLYPADDSAQLLGSIRRALRNPDEMRRMADNARHRAERDLSPQKMIDETLEVLATLANRESSSQ